MTAVIQSKRAKTKYSWIHNWSVFIFYVDKWTNIIGGNLFISKIVWTSDPWKEHCCYSHCCYCKCRCCWFCCCCGNKDGRGSWGKFSRRIIEWSNLKDENWGCNKSVQYSISGRLKNRHLSTLKEAKCEQKEWRRRGRERGKKSKEEIIGVI